RRARGRPGADGRARPRARRLLPRRATIRVGRLLGRRRGIRAAGSLPEVLSSLGLVDQHAHGIPREPPASLDELRGLFSESQHPAQWPHVAASVTYRRAIRELAELLGCAAAEDAVLAHRLASDPDEYAATLLRATGTEWLLVDDGFPPPGEGEDWRRMGELAGCRSACVMRIERVAEEGLERGYRRLGELLEHVRGEVAAARGGAARGARGERGLWPAPRPGALRLRRRRPAPALGPPGPAEAAARALPRHALRAPALLPVRPRGGLARPRLPQRLLRPLADRAARRPAGRGAAGGARAGAVLEAA